MRSNERRNENARQTALEKIVENIGWENFTTEDAKQTNKSLRATYQQEFNKIEKLL
jgi:DNA invertase Pin-like site-specific DNA recombinase